MWHCRVLKCDASYSWRLCPFRDVAATPRPSKLHTIKVFNTAKAEEVCSPRSGMSSLTCVLWCVRCFFDCGKVCSSCVVCDVWFLWSYFRRRHVQHFWHLYNKLLRIELNFPHMRIKQTKKMKRKKKRKLNGAWKNAV